MTLPISAFVTCMDDEKTIEGCLRSLPMCNEIVVVDGGSTDRTPEILRGLQDEGLPLRIISEPWRGRTAQKQFALEQCTLDWCLDIDPDERVSRRLDAALPDLIGQDGTDGWTIRRYEYLAGLGYVSADTSGPRQTRLVRRGAGQFDLGDPVSGELQVKGKVGKASEGGFLHFAPVMISREIEEIDERSSLLADRQAGAGKAAQPWKMVAAPVCGFFRSYVIHGMWRGGWAGFVRAGNEAIGAYLTEAKRWQDQAVARIPPAEPDNPKGY